MKQAGIVEFLKMHGLDALVELGVINGEKRLLTGESVGNLIALMKAGGVGRLVHEDKWYLDASGVFVNEYYNYPQETKLSELHSPSDVFKMTNPRLNPYYEKYAGEKKPAASSSSKPPFIDYTSRIKDLEGAGGMSGMINAFPLNRKERYWTGTVFPVIVSGARFCRLNKFLSLAGAPERFVRESYQNGDVAFYTEYGLKESALGWPEIGAIRRDTPDIVIAVGNGGEWFLAVVEAKMFDYVVSEDLARQLECQKPVIRAIASHNAIPPENIVHVALLYSSGPEFEAALKPSGANIILWRDILSAYPELEGDYFYEMLKIAVANPRLVTTREAYLKRKGKG